MTEMGLTEVWKYEGKKKRELDGIGFDRRKLKLKKYPFWELAGIVVVNANPFALYADVEPELLALQKIPYVSFLIFNFQFEFNLKLMRILEEIQLKFEFELNLKYLRFF